MKNKVTISPDRVFACNGKRCFPIIARHIPLGASLRDLSEAGFNTFRWTAFGTDSETQDNALPLDLADLMINAYVFDRGDLLHDSGVIRVELSELVHSICNHPNLLFYEQRNEPAWTPAKRATPQATPEGLCAGSTVIRSIDSDHPIRIGHMVGNLSSTLRAYNPAIDVLGCNPYVIRGPKERPYFCWPDGRYVDSADQTLSAVGLHTSKMMKVAEGRPVLMQIQAMAWENWFNPDLEPKEQAPAVTEADKLYPTAWQMRFMAFNAIIRGATGLSFAMHGTPIHSDAWTDICNVIGELKDLQVSLAGQAVAHQTQIQYEELGHSDWDGVELLVKKTSDMLLLFAANVQANPVVAHFSNLPDGIGRELFVHAEDRRVVVEEGRFTDRFEAHEVHVYSTHIE